MLQGFADSFPSESIQAHAAPGLAVSLVFPYKPGVDCLDVPVTQYKNVKLRNKAGRAKSLATWLREQKSEGLVMPGFMIADTWASAADVGLRFLPELPDARVVPHHDSYRLQFGDSEVDFPQAVALQYYFFVMHMGCLRAGLKIAPGGRNLVVLMDRFPHADTAGATPGHAISPTPGSQLLEYMDKKSKTWIEIHKQNQEIGLSVRFGNLNWWREAGNIDWKKGKTNPHFKLPDWLNQAVIADTHYDEFVAMFDDPGVGKNIADALKDLRQAFGEFDIWNMTPGTIGHIIPNEQLWEVPEEAKQFIYDRVAGSS